MLHLQLKRIQTAITAGRLDEAFELLVATPQREHRDGQRVTDVLIKKFVDRAHQHLDQQRSGDARSDADKAQRLAGRTDDVANLVQRVAQMESEHRSRDAAEQASARAAKIQAQLGHFTLGQNLLPTGPSQSRLAAEIERKRALAAAAADRIEQAIETGDWSAGIAIVKSLDPELQHHRLVVMQINAMLEPIRAQIVGDLESGRLDRGNDWLALAVVVAPTDARLNEMRSCFDRCVRACELVDQANYVEAERELALVDQIVPGTRWIAETRTTLAELARQSAGVRSGPLGLLDGTTPPHQTAPSAKKVSDTFFHTPSAQSALFAKKVSDTFLGVWVLRVDGLGAVLLLDADRISVGSASRSKRYDLPLMTEGPSSALFIRRAGEDYFAESDAEFGVNDQPTRRRLLANGDSIGFGRRGRLKFRKPVPASGSALLQLSGAGLAKREIRCAALMADSLLFSPRGGHFSISGCERPIVVFRTAEGYAIKYAGCGGETSPLVADRSVLLGETRFTLNQITLS
ncbi:hypothetical protein Enr13x_51320 [Stieleria neptunia]|uniref:Uncharacterized protein n=1 Tax=Stieleria neptunia TaxID=2527979 RepID=A0A518HWY3_9BACT|nr:hypothetical protein [Stieleria neptunia]QDV45257.1 hypothetical protein Enr13x_51320 [Stieleria neptunia]